MSSEYVQIPIGILKKEEYEIDESGSYDDSSKSDKKQYQNNREHDYSSNNERTIPITFQSEVKIKNIVSDT